MKTPKLIVRSVDKSFASTDKRPLRALSSLSLHVKHGEFVSLIGPSACGKSTLLHIIAGLTEPTAGKVRIDGKSRESRLGKSGYMPQKPLLLPWLTVQQNVMLGSRLQNQPAELAAHTAGELLEKFGLTDFADQYPSVLSGGMAQKAALLRTMISHEDFWLMDEPFGALDAITRLSMQLWLMEVWRDMDATALLVTHDIREAILLSDRIYVLSKRPGTVIKEVRVDLPRPRRKEFLARTDILSLETELENLLLQP